jgi:hypothetical protein
MKNRFICILAVLTVGLCSTGCIPVPIRFTSSPGAAGLVVDSQTHEPIAGARVIFSKKPVVGEHRYAGDAFTVSDVSSFLTNTRPPLVLTGKQGRFEVPATHRWFIYWIPEVEETVWLLQETLVVQHPGYQPALVPISAVSSNPKTKFELVKLDPIPK